MCVESVNMNYKVSAKETWSEQHENKMPAAEVFGDKLLMYLCLHTAGL